MVSLSGRLVIKIFIFRLLLLRNSISVFSAGSPIVKNRFVRSKSGGGNGTIVEKLSLARDLCTDENFSYIYVYTMKI